MSQTTLADFLRTSTLELEAAGIATARLDMLVLLEDTLNTNRAQLLADSDLLISETQLRNLEKLVARRTRHEPLAYIRNKTEFCNREFFVDRRVLEPRPESETMIELLKQVPKVPTIIDVGTGSGALAITAKLELKLVTVYGVDIDENCLEVARKNARKLAATITLIKSNLLEAIPETLLDNAALLCNLPYVPDNFQINTAATHEPRLAIFGGSDGLDLYRKLFNQLDQRATKPTYILAESLPPQHEVLASIAKQSGFVLDRTEDFIQVFKIATDR